MPLSQRSKIKSTLRDVMGDCQSQPILNDKIYGLKQFFAKDKF